MELPLNHNDPRTMHIDLNSCFATICQQAFPHFRGRPLVVAAYTTAQGCVLAASIEAKKCGVRTGMTVREARMRAPGMIVRKPDTAMIRDMHIKFRTILKDYTPDIAVKSIDEIVMDFSSMQYVYKKPLTEVAQEIKLRIRKEVGEWVSCSVGIAPNRFWAKTAASMHKPDGLDVLTHKNIREVFSAMKLTDIHGINTRFEARLQICGIFTPIDFLDAPLQKLQKEVFHGIVGYYWYKRLRGYEIDAVEFARKSIGQDYALGQKTSDTRELSRILMKLCEKMGRRLRSHRYTAQGIYVAVSYDDWSFWHRRHLTRQQMYTTTDLYRNAQLIFNQQPVRKIVRKISVACYELTSQNAPEQLDLFSSPVENIKEKRVSDAMDSINDKYGEFTITPATMMKMEDIVLDRIAFGSVKEIQ